MKITARHIRAAYTMFRQLPPFSSWKLPPPEKVRFAATNSREVYGTYEADPHKITVSRYNVKSFHALAVTIAHEIIHLRQQITGTFNESQHNREFMRLAKRACDALGWDKTGFV